MERRGFIKLISVLGATPLIGKSFAIAGFTSKPRKVEPLVKEVAEILFRTLYTKACEDYKWQDAMLAFKEVKVFEDPALHRQRRFGFYSWVDKPNQPDWTKMSLEQCELYEANHGPTVLGASCDYLLSTLNNPELEASNYTDEYEKIQKYLRGIANSVQALIREKVENGTWRDLLK